MNSQILDESTTQEKSPQDWAEDLLAVAQDQDRAAFARLFKHFAPRIRAYLMGLPSEHSSAEIVDELVQEAMLKAWTKAKYFDPNKAAVSTWLFTIARNCRIDYLRKAMRVNENLSADDIWAVSEEPEPYTYLEQDKAGQSVHKALESLPDEQADVIRRIYLEGKTHSEIATITGLPLGTVKSRARLAMGRLRTIMS